MPDTFVLPRSGRPQLRINGSLLAKSDGRETSGKTQMRYHEIAIYQLEDARHAVAISYRTNWDGETGCDTASVLDNNPASVSSMLAGYVPTYHVQGFPPGLQFADKQLRLLKDIAARYDAQVSELLSSEAFTEDASVTRPATIFSITNHHVPGCGPPPFIDGDNERRYHGYYENMHGEQLIFVYDRTTREATLWGGDWDWQKPRPVTGGRAPSLVLSPDENTWLHACWRAATGTDPISSVRALARKEPQ